jgi:CysZ protein
MAPKTALDRPGFLAGFGSVLSGFGFLVKTPRAWPYALVPAVLLVVTSMTFIWIAIAVIRPWISGWLDFGTSWLAQSAGVLLSWLAGLVAAFAGVLLSLIVTPPLAGPALERIVAQKEADLGVPPREDLGILAEIWCGLRAQAFAAIFAIPILTLLWVIEILVAPAVFITTPLKVIVSAFCLAWNLFDYPLTLRGVRMRDRFALVMSYKRAALGFGLAFALLFWFPCFGILMLPVGVVAATRLLWRMLDGDPNLLPQIARKPALALPVSRGASSAQVDGDAQPAP